MLGSSGKLGRSGGGRGIKRLIPPPSSHRPVRAPSQFAAGRTSTSRQRSSGSLPATTPDVPEETFKLLSDDSLAFGLIIRLTPDLVEEIRRIEAQGAAARIKFDANPNNTSGNVIDVGGKNFQFTWSRELSDCDIYEEHKSEDDTCGLLTESGSVWRKLNVQRVLDESTKNHVKKRTEEAQQLLKSRKAIVLDPANPSVKNQVKTLAAVDTNPRRFLMKQRKEPPFKRQKHEKDPCKTVFRSGTSTVTTTQVLKSPQPAFPEQFGTSISPLRNADFCKGHLTADAVNLQMNKDDVPISKEKNSSKDVATQAQDISRDISSVCQSDKSLRKALIELLLDNPKGMDLKALEKAVGETYTNAGMKIGRLMKQISTFQAPDRYFLRPGIDVEWLQNAWSAGESSFECMQNQLPSGETTFLEKGSSEEMQTEALLSSTMASSGMLENHNQTQHSPESSKKKVDDFSEGKCSTSSDSRSGSESETDSSNSESESGSRSRSKSRSPAISESATTSDTDTESSCSSKDASDVVVDIMMSDDEKGETTQNLCISESELERGTSFNGLMQNDLVESKGGFASEAAFCSSSQFKCGDADALDDSNINIDIFDDSPASDTCGDIGDQNESGKCHDILLHKHSEGPRNSQISTPCGHDHSGNSNIPDGIINESNALKVVFGDDSPASKSFENAHVFSDGKYIISSSRRQSLKEEISDNDEHHEEQIETGDKNVSLRSPLPLQGMHQRKLGSDFLNSSSMEKLQLSNEAIEVCVAGNSNRRAEKMAKHDSNLARGGINSEKPSTFPFESDNSVNKTPESSNKSSKPRDNLCKDSYADQNDSSEKCMQSTKDTFIRVTQSDSNYKKIRQCSGLHKSERVNRDEASRRELSDLELGEFRESLHSGEAQGASGHVERNNFFKSAEVESHELRSVCDEIQGNSRLLKQKKSSVPLEDVPKTFDVVQKLSYKFMPSEVHELPRTSLSPNNANDQEGLITERIFEDGVEDTTFHDHMDAEYDNYTNNRHLSERTTVHQTRTDGDSISQWDGMEMEVGPLTHMSISRPEEPVTSSSSKETETHEAKSEAEHGKRGGDCFEVGRHQTKRRKGSSSDEECSAYSKYDKEEAEFKGPIKDHYDYMEYVQEYREMYGDYCSLNRHLEKYRSEFTKLGHDLELAKDKHTDRYHAILEQIKDIYCRSGMRHKRLKKIFVVIDEELRQTKQRILEYAESYPGE